MSDSQQPGWGSGAGQGGGAGGSIRSAGGAFGQMEAAHEEQYFRQQVNRGVHGEAGGAFGKMEAFQEEDYFRKKQAEQLAALKEHVHDEISYHEKEIKDHLEDIQRHKEKLAKLTELHAAEKK